tara:strand:+ start:118 stop:408 length:291 start_codon:yes stop_codon:yes gene_type:complete
MIYFLQNTATNREFWGGTVHTKHRTGILDGLGCWGPQNLIDSDCKANYFFVPTLIKIYGRGKAYSTEGKPGLNLEISIHTVLTEIPSAFQKKTSQL